MLPHVTCSCTWVSAFADDGHSRLSSPGSSRHADRARDDESAREAALEAEFERDRQRQRSMQEDQRRREEREYQRRLDMWERHERLVVVPVQWQMGSKSAMQCLWATLCMHQSPHWTTQAILLELGIICVVLWSSGGSLCAENAAAKRAALHGYHQADATYTFPGVGWATCEASDATPIENRSHNHHASFVRGMHGSGRCCRSDTTIHT